MGQTTLDALSVPCVCPLPDHCCRLIEDRGSLCVPASVPSWVVALCGGQTITETHTENRPAQPNVMSFTQVSDTNSSQSAQQMRTAPPPPYSMAVRAVTCQGRAVKRQQKSVKCTTKGSETTNGT